MTRIQGLWIPSMSIPTKRSVLGNLPKKSKKGDRRHPNLHWNLIKKRKKWDVVVCQAGIMRHRLFKVQVVPCIRRFITVNRVLLVGLILSRKWKTSKCKTILTWLTKWFMKMSGKTLSPSYRINRCLRSLLLSLERIWTPTIMVAEFQLELLQCLTSLLHHLKPSSIHRWATNTEKISPKWSTKVRKYWSHTKTWVKKSCTNCLKINES